MRAQRGFTLVEILIAVAILGVGVAGIVALFPATIQTASRAVEDTYAASIADSVVASLSGARRDHRLFRALPGNATPAVPKPLPALPQKPGGTPPTKYILFDHDGALDAIVTPTPGASTTGTAYYAANWAKDYVVLLPTAGTSWNTDPNSEPTLFYPYAGQTPTRAPATIAGGIADEIQLKPTVEGKLVLWVKKTYLCGRYREGTAPTGFNTGDPRVEFLVKGATGPNVPLIDQYPQYSFAFSLRRAKKVDYSTALPMYSIHLYECHVLVYRNFDGSAATQAAIQAGGPIPRCNEPVHEFVTMIDIGPKGDVGTGVPLINNQPLNQPSGGGGTPAGGTGDAGEADPLEDW